MRKTKLVIIVKALLVGVSASIASESSVEVKVRENVAGAAF
jgi:hypothetical protein